MPIDRLVLAHGTIIEELAWSVCSSQTSYEIGVAWYEGFKNVNVVKFVWVRGVYLLLRMFIYLAHPFCLYLAMIV